MKPETSEFSRAVIARNRAVMSLSKTVRETAREAREDAREVCVSAADAVVDARTAVARSEQMRIRRMTDALNTHQKGPSSDVASPSHPYR